MITFDEALVAAEMELGLEWPPGHGTFFVSPNGHEDADSYTVDYGAEEWLLGGDEDYNYEGNLIAFVDKADGHVHKEPFLMVEQRLQQMTPVSLADSAG